MNDSLVCPDVCGGEWTEVTISTVTLRLKAPDDSVTPAQSAFICCFFWLRKVCRLFLFGQINRFSPAAASQSSVCCVLCAYWRVSAGQTLSIFPPQPDNKSLAVNVEQLSRATGACSPAHGTRSPLTPTHAVFRPEPSMFSNRLRTL